MTTVKPQQPSEVLIDGRLYEISDFRHPGGSIMKFFAGSGDATGAFIEFHQRSKKAHKMLDTLPSRPAPADLIVGVDDLERHQKLQQSYLRFRRSLEEEGYFEPSLMHVLYRIVEIPMLYAFAFWLIMRFGGKMWLPAATLCGTTGARCAWIMHEAGHYSLTGNIYADQRIQEIYMGFFAGYSASWWRINHNKHHAATQKLGYDADLNTLPVVAYHESVAAQAKDKPLVREWIKLQKYMFLPAICGMVGLLWKFFLHPRHMLRTNHRLELFYWAARFFVYFGLGAYLGYSFGQTFWFWFYDEVFHGTQLLLVIAVNHSHLPAGRHDKHVHWMQFGCDYSIDIPSNMVSDWMTGYLNLQIEHHLFPTMPGFNLPKIAARTKQFYEENGFHYDCRPFTQALGDVLDNLGMVADSLYGC